MVRQKRPADSGADYKTGQTRTRGSFSLTKRFIDRLELPTSQYGKRYYDQDIRGFGVAIYPSGKKTFFIEYGPRGHQRRMKIGLYGQLTLAQARELAREKLADYVRGSDPMDTRQAENSEIMFGEWADDYIERMRSMKKHVREDIRYLEEAKKRWKSRPLSSISTEDVERFFFEKEKEVSKITANRWLASIRACLQDAWRKDRIPQNPAMKVKSFPENPPKRRVLTDKELSRVLQAIDKFTDVHVKAAFMLLIQTGARKSEVLNARWEDFNLDDRLWTIPSTKAGHPQMMPLPPEIVVMLKHLPRLGPYVIPGRKAGRPRSDLKRPWKKIQDAAKISDVHIHDIRRTFGLHITRKAGLHVASKLLRHSDIRVTEKHYAPLGMEELQKALDRREADVIPLRNAKKKRRKRG
jgi:integrase